jgi:glutathione peroxidase
MLSIMDHFSNLLVFQQEPGSPVEIMNALEHVRPGNGFIPNFPLFAKSDINGANRLPLYAWVTVNL